MNITYIKNVSTLEELKKEYKRLAMIHHPDCGGDTEIMKLINNEYDYLFPKLKNTHKNKEGQFYEKENKTEDVGEWKDLIDKLISLQMIKVSIEIIGSFVWVSGETKPYKEELKKLGFKWSQNKTAWYMAPEGYKRHSRKQYELNEIRDMYGSSTIKNEKAADEKDTKKKVRAKISA